MNSLSEETPVKDIYDGHFEFAKEVRKTAQSSHWSAVNSFYVQFINDFCLELVFLPNDSEPKFAYRILDAFNPINEWGEWKVGNTEQILHELQKEKEFRDSVILDNGGTVTA